MIRTLGRVEIPPAVLEHAETIKRENYKTNTPARFQVRTLAGGQNLICQLAPLAGHLPENLDFVYFSACRGAEPHTDRLDPNRFHDTTFVVPVILPLGRSVIEAQGHEVVAEVGAVYEFDHTRTHSMTLEDTESGCVVVMVAVKR